MTATADAARLRGPDRRERPRKTLAPVHPNAGLEALYRKRLMRLIDEMHRSLAYWIGAAYRPHPAMMAQDDASPAIALREAVRQLRRRWIPRFDKASTELGAWFAQAAAARSDAALQAILRDAGISVRFTLTRQARAVLEATTGENVALIRSIGQQYFTAIEASVMSSAAAGRDLGAMSKQLEARYEVTKRRAALISRDQNNKATATITRVRQQALGIKQAVWVHSNAGAKPRPSHVKAGTDRVVYDVDKGWFDPDEGQWIRPGELINCRCVSRPVLPGF